MTSEEWSKMRQIFIKNIKHFEELPELKNKPNHIIHKMN